MWTWVDRVLSLVERLPWPLRVVVSIPIAVLAALGYLVIRTIADILESTEARMGEGRALPSSRGHRRG